MISVAAARAIVLEHAQSLGAEDVAVEASLGRTLAEAVVATRPQPPFHASAMDGYAVRSIDTPGSLQLAGEAGAGHAFKATLAPGACIRIFTGAPLPVGADAIVIQEDAIKNGAAVSVPEVFAGKHVRPAGGDFVAGETLLVRGDTLDAAGVTNAAAAGRATISVARRPRLTILGGGDEIVAPGGDIGPDQIFDCASFGVNALATGWGAASKRGPLLRDDPKFIMSAMETALASSDLLVMIGGASVGDHDHTRTATLALGGRILFDKISLRPGKPTWFALYGERTILGLPGNPASALVTARLFLRPMLAKMLGGDPAKSVRLQRAVLTAPLEATGPREAYLRAKTFVGDDARHYATPAANQDSSLVSVFAAAGALIVRDANSGSLEAGDLVHTLSI